MNKLLIAIAILITAPELFAVKLASVEDLKKRLIKKKFGYLVDNSSIVFKLADQEKTAGEVAVLIEASIVLYKTSIKNSEHDADLEARKGELIDTILEDDSVNTSINNGYTITFVQEDNSQMQV